MSNSEEKLQFYKLSLYSTIAFLIVMAAAFSYTIYDFQRGIKATVENDLSVVRSEVRKAIELSTSTDLTDFTNLLTQQLVGAVIAFNAEACPSGWQEYQPAYGRFIRGIDNGVMKIDSDGKRSPGSIQQDAMKSHKHEFVDPGHVHSMGPFSRAKNIYDSGSGRSAWAHYSAPNRQVTSSKTNISINDFGDEETRPKNVSLLYCIKK